MDRDTDTTDLERLIENIRENFGILCINPLEVGLLMKHSEEIEPFYHVTNLRARSVQEHSPWEDLRFLKLFPNTRFLGVYDYKQGDRNVAKAMSFDGIQNCVNLERVYSHCIRVPPILTGIEFCKNLRKFLVRVAYEGDRPMDITPLSGLPYLKYIRVKSLTPDRNVLVETEGLNLSGCRSLKSLFICPTSKDLRFLGSVQLKFLCTPHSELESLEGLDTTMLKYINISHNRITCIERLRGAKLRKAFMRHNLEGNPVDPDDLKEVSATWL